MKIIAIDGDCSANGMSDTATVKTVTPKQWSAIQRFHAVNEKAFEVLMSTDKELQQKHLAEYDAVTELCSNLGCWSNKYEARSIWAPV